MERIGNIIVPFIKELGIDTKIKHYEALSIWSNVVGERIARVTEPERIVDGKLFIKVRNDAWRNELLYMKSDLISRVNMKLGRSLIKDILLI